MHNRQLHSLSSVPLQSVAADQTVLVLADNLRIPPDVLIGNGNGIFGSGVQGSGKTGILVRILEQAAQFHVPMVIFDREGDIIPAVERFPRGIIGTFSNCPSAKDIIKGGLQVIYDLSSWPTMDERGLFIAYMVNSLYKIVDGLPVSHRTPCLIGLDEAALFLPQRRGEVFSVEVYKAMADAFHNVATTGRKRGLTPVLFTQKISE
jgi:DNA helicase HerA-like ATPase